MKMKDYPKLLRYKSK